MKATSLATLMAERAREMIYDSLIEQIAALESKVGSEELPIGATLRFKHSLDVGGDLIVTPQGLELSDAMEDHPEPSN